MCFGVDESLLLEGGEGVSKRLAAHAGGIRQPAFGGEPLSDRQTAERPRQSPERDE